MKPNPHSIMVQPGSVPELHAFGDVLSVLLSGEQTDNKFTVMFDVTPPGGGPPPHVHSREDEFFLVVEGRISYFAEGEWTEVDAGGAVYFPRGVVPCYRNVGETPSKHWILTTPSGFEHFFAASAAEFVKSDGPDMPRLIEIAREHGIDYV